MLRLRHVGLDLLISLAFFLDSPSCRSLLVANPHTVIVGSNALDYWNVARLYFAFISTRIKTLKSYLRKTRCAILMMVASKIELSVKNSIYFSYRRNRICIWFWYYYSLMKQLFFIIIVLCNYIIIKIKRL